MVMCGMYSDISFDILPRTLIFYLTFFLAFYVASIWRFYLALCLGAAVAHYIHCIHCIRSQRRLWTAVSGECKVWGVKKVEC